MPKGKASKLETEVYIVKKIISNIRGRLNLHTSKIERLEERVDSMISSYNKGLKMESDLAINVDMSELDQTKKQVEHLNELLREANSLIEEISLKKIKLDVYI